MKVKQLTIRNYRSLKEVNMQNLQNLVILIGDNGSGKTNILEALTLFLTSFDTFHTSAYRRTLTDDDWYLWFNGETDSPIEFQITLERLTKSEIEELAEIAKSKQEGELVLNRSIICENKGIYYQNDLIKWGAIRLSRAQDPALGSNFYSTTEGEPWALPIKEAMFNSDSFAQVVNRMLKDRFCYISLGREDKPSAAHDSILDPRIRDELIEGGRNTTPQGMKKWNLDIRRYKERGWTPGQLECKGERLFLPKERISLPYELDGGGYQAFLNLLKQIEMGSDIVAIEEPENHLHPELQKRFVRELKQLLDSKKQIFIATHSPFIVDLADLETVWFVHLHGLETKAHNITDEKELSNVFWRIGVKPSDFLFANGVLVVEGETDKDVYTDWARKIGKPFEKVAILVVNAEGCGNIKKYLQSEIIQRTSFIRYCLCDKNAEIELRKAVTEIVPNENILVLNKGDIEDYYPRELVLEFAKEWSQKKGREETEIPNEIKQGETVKKLNELLGEDRWKRRLATKVMQEMKPQQIDDEVKNKLVKIYNSIEEIKKP